MATEAGLRVPVTNEERGRALLTERGGRGPCVRSVCRARERYGPERESADRHAWLGDDARSLGVYMAFVR